MLNFILFKCRTELQRVETSVLNKFTPFHPQNLSRNTQSLPSLVVFPHFENPYQYLGHLQMSITIHKQSLDDLGIASHKRNLLNKKKRDVELENLNLSGLCGPSKCFVWHLNYPSFLFLTKKDLARTWRMLELVQHLNVCFLTEEGFSQDMMNAWTCPAFELVQFFSSGRI